VFCYDDIYSFEETPALAQDFAQSPAFQECAEDLLVRLVNHTGHSAPYADAIFEACRILDYPEVKADGDAYQGVIQGSNHLFQLVLRLYEQAQDSNEDGTQEKCLDAMDCLFHAGWANERELLKTER